MAKILSLGLGRNNDPESQGQLTAAELRQKVGAQAAELVAYAENPRPSDSAEEISFKAFEGELIPKVFALARTLIVLQLTAAHRRVDAQTPERTWRDGRVFRRVPELKARNLETWFGVVRYWRRYMVEATKAARRGFHPLDVALGLMADRISMTLLAVCVRLATKLSFAEARSTAQWFLPTVPSTEVIEQSVLGFGRYTAEWFERRPAPEGDGEVLEVMIDSKGAPMATEQELKLRRGQRRKARVPKSPRHRGRHRRQRLTPRRRRKKGDKAKNAKMATLVVMYTLKRQGPYLVGPINRWVYGSFASKKHAFVIARREANKRGFTPDSGKLVQLVTDGDDDLECYARHFFPEAQHTLDVIHVTEKLWDVGTCFHPEGSEALDKWVHEQKQWLYRGKVTVVLAELMRRLNEIPKTGPGNRGKRDRLDSVINYLVKRKAMMNYDELLDQDLEISTGVIEGAIKYLIGRRCDHGGMRWIKERAEAVLQLRCIDFNDDWEAFVQYVHDAAQRESRRCGERVRLQQKEPTPLPEVTELVA
jgi:hypothetical protein